MADPCCGDAAVLHCPKCRATVRPPANLGDGVFRGVCKACGHAFAFRAQQPASSTLTFVVDGKQVTVNNPDPNMTLNEWLRTQAGRTGTKRSCLEGGCGACTVTLTKTDPTTSETVHTPINSCLKPLCAVDGCEITTVQGIGSRTKGYHPIQQALAAHWGSQCGYCSPGMVMNMYSLLQQNPKPTAQEVEDHFDGNICRCTGYRPILDAMKSFASDSASAEGDIEAIVKRPCSTMPCASACHMVSGQKPLRFVNDDGTIWERVTSLSDLFAALQQYSTKAVKLVVGNTSMGVFKDDKYDVYLDISSVTDLNSVATNSTELVVGSTVTLAELIDALQQNASASSSFPVLATHLLKIANVGVRSAGCWAGNLMMAHDHSAFPSDVFTIMAATGALLSVAINPTTVQKMNLFQFLQTDMKGKVIVSLHIPCLTAGQQLVTFKIMPRHENAHAYVNAGFLFSTDQNYKVTGTCRFVYGGIGVKPQIAADTAAVFQGKQLNDVSVMQQAIKKLQTELKPDSPAVWASAAYRMSLAASLLYKAVVKVVPTSARIQSAGSPIPRPVSSGTQSYKPDPSEDPVSEAMPKLTAQQQTAGEAVYVDDLPVEPGTLFGAFMLSNKANAVLSSVDVTKVKAAPGVVAVLLAEDLPKDNNVYPAGPFHPNFLFVPTGSRIEYHGQAVGLVLATTQRHANDAAKLVSMAVTDQQTPILTIEQAITAKSYLDAGLSPVTMGENIDKALAESAHVVTGEIECGSQYHFHLETQTCQASPLLETGGLAIKASTQSVDWTQSVACQVTGLDKSQVNVEMARMGGAYGGKITQNFSTAAACSVAAYTLGVPVRMVVDLNTNMRMLGKRHPWLAKYSAGIDSNGKLHAMKIDYFTDCGFSVNDSDGTMAMALTACDAAYTCPNWTVTPFLMKTNKPSNTATRGPGCCPAIFSMESIMDHCARSIGVDPVQFRQDNVNKQGDVTPYGSVLKYCSLPTMWKDFVASSDYQARTTAVNTFNAQNRWKKRGISVAPNKYGITWMGAVYSCNVTVFGADGTVLVSSGGAESGQGLNTKVAQVTAYALGCPLAKIRVQPTNTFIDPNNTCTGGSISSELCCTAVLQACTELKQRIDAATSTMKSPTWEEKVAKCYGSGIELAQKGWVNQPQSTPFEYFSYGMVCTEVELDILTGEHEIRRVDILFDCGQSLNPAVDIGQVEGGFVMGLGYWLSEQIKYQADGTLLTDGTWEYKPPGAKDIPIDFRVTLLPNAPNPAGFLRSKASGEPPLMMAASVMFALKYAMTNARAEIKDADFFPLDGPATPEAVQQLCKVDPSQFTF